MINVSLTVGVGFECSEIYKKINNVNNLLDVGCGEGYLVNCLANKLNKKVAGFDISDSGFAKSHDKCKIFNTCSLIECVKGDVCKIDNYFQYTFDAITLAYTLHHLERSVTTLKSVPRQQLWHI
jgi:ubiquinone/menaquinone biosynthesis C-methylase UbiE